ncbi:phage tail protein [Sphingomonas mali]|uniref:phage tail protein n=1 Tax=Sphingomonas mali TaxID=40682 RepID=UPI0008315A69|nr:tail fiber protein [Sphingomonas mali]
MADPYVAEIRMFAGNFAPIGWALCNGQLLPISQNTALFSLLGTTYGGNGTTNFQLPDLQGRAPMHPGNGPGLTPRDLGETGGENNVTLLTTEMPAHTHPISGAVIANSNPGETPSTNSLFTNSSPNQLYAAAAPTSQIPLAPQSISLAGGSQPHNNSQPYLAVTFIIALQGVFPARN